MKQLYLTYAEQRRLHGMDSYGTPSRFIAEMPAELVEEVRPRIQRARGLGGPALAGGAVARFRELAASRPRRHPAGRSACATASSATA